MKIVVAVLVMVGAIAGLTLNWPALQRAAFAEPAVRAARLVPHITSTRDATTAGESAPLRLTGRPALRTPANVARDDGTTTLIRNIERVLVSVDADERDRVLEQDLPALVSIDARSAGALVERSEPGPVRDALRSRLARLWAAKDLNGALDWTRALSDTGERRLAAADVAAEVATSDPATALEVFDSFGIGRTDGTAEHVAQLWAEEHLQDALDYAQAQDPGPQRDQLLARIVAVQAARNPAAAASVVTRAITPGAAQRDATLVVARNWAIQDPEAASKWVATLADSALRERGRAEIARATQP